MSGRDCITIATRIRAAIINKQPFTMPVLRSDELKRVLNYLEADL